MSWLLAAAAQAEDLDARRAPASAIELLLATMLLLVVVIGVVWWTRARRGRRPDQPPDPPHPHDSWWNPSGEPSPTPDLTTSAAATPARRASGAPSRR